MSVCPFAASLRQWLSRIFAAQLDTTSIASILSICNQQWSPQVKELQDAIISIGIAHKKDWKSIWLERDSAMVVDIFNDNTIVP
ncbi:hypothetical protein Lal_00025229 [Lupinus albus]|nr:hypothetical protein Lal_00025229 [Lupinus albus]